MTGELAIQLMRLGEAGAERPAVRHGDVTYDLTPVTSDIDGSFLADDGIARTREALAGRELPELDADGMRVGAPVARPQCLLGVGLNYSGHAAESGLAPPSQPVMFLKHPNTIVGPYDDILMPPGSERLDWEAELAVVIGRRARYLTGPEDAASYIAGYCISNDVSERAYQLEQSGGQWSKGKCCETFNPMGPWLVPADQVDPGSLGIWSSVNGEPRQDSSTADMIFSVPTLVWHLSHYVVLEPGDVISTGTPQGVALSGRFPYLRHGDVYEAGIDSLGTQRQVVVGPR
jgi:2-keto-4-pentenoate hydratase/2-oxohepta-3-ene-1,7-dioic acid hydratase in catechol pathway